MDLAPKRALPLLELCEVADCVAVVPELLLEHGVDALPDRARPVLEYLDVLGQIEAAQAALDKIALGPVDDQPRDCIRSGDGACEAQVQELMGPVSRLVISMRLLLRSTL